MMVTACINNVGILPESLLDLQPYPSPEWLSPRISFSRDLTGEDRRNGGEKLDQDDSLMDFEFRLSDPVAMLSADELFSNGKLVPLHLTPIRAATAPHPEINKSPAAMHSPLTEEMICRPDHCVSSPKAPKCASRWKEMLGLKKSQNREADRVIKIDPPTYKISDRTDAKTPKRFVHRNPRFSSNDSSNLSCPLLRDSFDSESVSISARISLSSSSSSGADHEDIPRLSLDLDRINSAHPPLPPRHKVGKAMHPVITRRTLEFSGDGNISMHVGSGPIRRTPESAGENHSGWRTARNPSHQSAEIGDIPPPLCVSVDSPRLNASGKVIFQGLGRSSSSPSFLNAAGTRPRHVQRSYSSANIRVKPVLNVPVCNLRSTAKSVSSSFGQLFVPQKRNISSCTKS